MTLYSGYGNFNGTVPYISGAELPVEPGFIGVAYGYTIKAYVEGGRYSEDKLLLLDEDNDVLYIVSAPSRPFTADNVTDDVANDYLTALSGGGGGSMTAGEIRDALATLTGADRLGANSIKEDSNRNFLTDAQASAITANSAKNSYPTSDATKVGYISVTQAVDLDDIESELSEKVTKKSATLTSAATVSINCENKDQAVFDLVLDRAAMTLSISNIGQHLIISAKKTYAGITTLTIDDTNYYFADIEGAELSSVAVNNDASTNAFCTFSFLKSATLEASSKPVVQVATSKID